MEEKRAAIELWKASVPLKKIREQLSMNERTLRRILSHAKANPDAPVALPGREPPLTIEQFKIKNIMLFMPAYIVNKKIHVYVFFTEGEAFFLVTGHVFLRLL